MSYLSHIFSFFSWRSFLRLGLLCLFGVYVVFSISRYSYSLPEYRVENNDSLWGILYEHVFDSHSALTQSSVRHIQNIYGDWREEPLLSEIFPYGGGEGDVIVIEKNNLSLVRNGEVLIGAMKILPGYAISNHVIQFWVELLWVFFMLLCIEVVAGLFFGKNISGERKKRFFLASMYFFPFFLCVNVQVFFIYFFGVSDSFWYFLPLLCLGIWSAHFGLWRYKYSDILFFRYSFYTILLILGIFILLYFIILICYKFFDPLGRYGEAFFFLFSFSIMLGGIFLRKFFLGEKPGGHVSAVLHEGRMEECVYKGSDVQKISFFGRQYTQVFGKVCMGMIITMMFFLFSAIVAIMIYYAYHPNHTKYFIGWSIENIHSSFFLFSHIEYVFLFFSCCVVYLFYIGSIFSDRRMFLLGGGGLCVWGVILFSLSFIAGTGYLPLVGEL